MTPVLLVFDDENELAFIKANLEESSISVIVAEGLEQAKEVINNYESCLVVINKFYQENDVVDFCKLLKQNHAAKMCVMSLVDPGNYYSSPFIDYLMVKPIRPKLLLSIIRALSNNETISWMPEVH